MTPGSKFPALLLLSLILATTATSQTDNPPEPAELRERFESGKRLSRNGQYAQALQRFLSLWDLDPEVAGPIRGIRQSLLLAEIARVAEAYPTALHALQQRIEKLEAKWQTNQSRDALSDLFAIGSYFPSEVDALALFDDISKNSSYRFEFAHYVVDPLLAAGRFDDILRYYRPLVQLERAIIATQRRDARLRNTIEGRRLRVKSREFLRVKARKDVHALIAGGEPGDAIDYARMYLDFDGSKEAQSALRAGAAEAGEPAFFDSMIAQ